MGNNFVDDMIFYRVFNAANYELDYEFEDGVNSVCSIKEYKPDYNFEFVEVKDIFRFLDSGPAIRRVYPMNPVILYTYTAEKKVKWYTDSVYSLGPVEILNVDTIKRLILEGANIAAGNYNIIRWSLKYNFEVFYYLQEYLCETNEDLWAEIIYNLKQEGSFDNYMNSAQ